MGLTSTPNQIVIYMTSVSLAGYEKKETGNHGIAMENEMKRPVLMSHRSLYKSRPFNALLAYPGDTIMSNTSEIRSNPNYPYKSTFTSTGFHGKCRFLTLRHRYGHYFSRR